MSPSKIILNTSAFVVTVIASISMKMHQKDSGGHRLFASTMIGGKCVLANAWTTTGQGSGFCTYAIGIRHFNCNNLYTTIAGPFKTCLHTYTGYFSIVN